jgi:ABC-type sugar transport system permease subunit
MNKPFDNRAWFLVLPVFAIVAFSAVLPLMTVVNYSVQDTFGNNQFFWNGVGWFQDLLDPSKELGGRFFDALWRNLLFSAIVLAIQVPLGILVALSMPREGWTPGTSSARSGRSSPAATSASSAGASIGSASTTTTWRARSQPGPPSSSWTSGTGRASWRCCATRA